MLLGKAVLAASGAAGIKGKGPLASMFGDHRCDALACSALLRLLVLDDTPFDDVALRPATALFDRVLGNRIYAKYGLSTKDQSFEKRDRLRTLVEEHETALLGHCQSLGSLDALGAFRERFGKLYQSQFTQVLMRPFLSPEVTAQSFSEVFTAAEHFRDSTDEEIAQRSENALEKCDHIRQLALSTATTYAKGLELAVAENLESLIRSELRKRGLSEPADLSLSFRQKRYPLGHRGSEVLLRVILSNAGPGQARDVALEIEAEQGDCLNVRQTEHFLPVLPPGDRTVEFAATVTTPAQRQPILFRVSWKNPDGERLAKEIVVDIEGQDASLPWEDLEYADPYPLEPVTDPAQFVGRDDLLRDLTKAILSGGNIRIQGQRRVGKTSIAHAAKDRVTTLRPEEFIFVFLESGDFGAQTAPGTLSRLGELVTQRITGSDPRLTTVETPDFESGLSPLTGVLAEAASLAPDKRFVIVLDEFDALPQPELYQHGPVGDSFFQTLRSLGGKPNMSFILIGGERMKWIVGVQGQVINKFKLVPVDYFKAEDSADYDRLVRGPIEKWFDVDQGAVRELYTSSAGNPWFTKIVAGELFDRQVANRDVDIQPEDVRQAITDSLPALGAENFQHFWDDAIRGDIEDQDYVSLTRRRVLLAAGAILRDRTTLTAETLVRRARNFKVDDGTADDVIRGLIDRGILMEDDTGRLNFRVPLFEQWLPEEGIHQIIVTMGDDDALIKRQRREEAARPKTDELQRLARDWGTYAGQLIQAEQIRKWLNQFGQPTDQRLMLQLLQNLKYYSSELILHHLRGLHKYVLRELAASGYEYKFSGRSQVRNDLLLTSLDGGGSGATHLLNPYRRENKIYPRNVLDAGDIPGALIHRNVRAVLVLEDFIATGSTAAGRLPDLYREWTADEPWPDSVDVFVLAVAGFDRGLDRARASVINLEWPTHVMAADELDDQDRCFSSNSVIFPDADEREQAQALCTEKGTALEPRHPVGYGDSQAAVCFESRCPNNSLPVLWKDSPSWEALFPRL